MEAFERDGFVLMEGLLDPFEAIAPVFAEYRGVLGGILESLYAEGRVHSVWADLPFGARYMRLVEATGDTFWRYFAPALGGTAYAVESATPICIGPAFFGLLTHPVLLKLIRRALGGHMNVSTNPGQRHRFKLPTSSLPASSGGASSVDTVDWHQDTGAFAAEAEKSRIVTAWIPLSPATEENGCLQVIPGSHKYGTLSHQRDRGGSQIPTLDQALLGDCQVVRLPAKVGDVILMRKGLVHASMANRSSADVRMSLDLRYQAAEDDSGYGPLPMLNVESAVSGDNSTRYWGYVACWHKARRDLAELGLPLLELGSSEQYVAKMRSRGRRLGEGA
jgi:phytanoyl-CoA hydroxylase